MCGLQSEEMPLTGAESCQFYFWDEIILRAFEILFKSQRQLFQCQCHYWGWRSFVNGTEKSMFVESHTHSHTNPDSPLLRRTTRKGNPFKQQPLSCAAQEFVFPFYTFRSAQRAIFVPGPWMIFYWFPGPYPFSFSKPCKWTAVVHNAGIQIHFMMTGSLGLVPLHGFVPQTDYCNISKLQYPHPSLWQFHKPDFTPCHWFHPHFLKSTHTYGARAHTHIHADIHTHTLAGFAEAGQKAKSNFQIWQLCEAVHAQLCMWHESGSDLKNIWLIW